MKENKTIDIKLYDKIFDNNNFKNDVINFFERAKIFNGKTEIEILNLNIFFEKLFHFLEEITDYKEEGSRFYPNIYVTNDFETATKKLKGNIKKIQLKSNDIVNENFSFKHLLKPIIPLNTFGSSIWIEYINKKITIYIVYPLSKEFSSIFKEFIFNNQYCKDKFFILNIYSTGKRNITIETFENNKLIIDLSFNNKKKENSHSINKFLKDLKGNKIKKKLFFKENEVIFDSKFKKLINNFRELNHGFILLLINHEYRKNINESPEFKDGRYFCEPIDLLKSMESKYNMNTTGMLEDIEKVNLEENLNFNILLSILPIDGITVMTDECQIIGYNILYKGKDNNENNKRSGNARSKTVDNILALKNNHNFKYIKGVLFCSQDGEPIYLTPKKGKGI